MPLNDYLPLKDNLMVEPKKELAEWLERTLTPLADYYFQTRIYGHENLPAGSALLVGNHGLYGYDAIIFMAKLFKNTGRMPRAIADHNFFRLPLLRESIARFGVVDGNPENVVKLLQEGHLGLVFPGGAREALRRHEDQPYQLSWGKSDGFIKVALKADVPLIPVAGIGPDEALSVVVEHDQVKNTAFGRAVKFLLGKKYIPAIALGLGALPIPRPIPFTYYIGKPTYLDYPPEAAQDRQVVRRLKRNFQKRLERLIQRGLQARRGQQPV